MLKRSACFAVCLSASSLALADQLVLNNGDTLQGKIVTMTAGELIFNSPVLGELNVTMDKIKSFSSDETITLQLASGDVIEPTISSAAEGFITFNDNGQQQNLALDQISGINPDPAKPVEWIGKLFAGVSIETGNTESQDVDLDVKATRETKQDRVILDARYEEDRSEDGTSGNLTTNKRYYALGGHYDYFVSDRTYVYGVARTEKESTANLEQRIKLGSGLGYRWVETSRTRFEVEGGLSWVSEDFTDTTPDQKYAAVRTATRLTHDLSSDIKLFNDAEWLMSLEDSADQLFSTDAGLAYRINGHLSLEAKLHYDWDKSPPASNGEDDFRYVFGVSWGF